jgi:preprotein translocase subunit SecG
MKNAVLYALILVILLLLFRRKSEGFGGTGGCAACIPA